MYTARIRRSGRNLDLTWDEGKLSGNPRLVALVRNQAKRWEDMPVGPVGGPYTRGRRAHLASGLSTVHLLREICDPGTVPEIISGDAPEPPETPPGAIV